MSGAYLATAACCCQASESCATCAAFSHICDDVADRRAERTERAIEDRNFALLLARHHAAIRRRPVRALPRRLPFDLDALADAVAVRLRRSP